MFVCLTFHNALSRYDKGGHLFLPSYIMRTHGSKKQQDVMKNVDGAQMQKVFEVVHVNFHFLLTKCHFWSFMFFYFGTLSFKSLFLSFMFSKCIVLVRILIYHLKC